MECCSAYGCDELFDEAAARRDADRYRRNGLDDLGRRIVDAVGASGSVLEVGGGVGALQVELLRAGVERVAAIELSPAYEPWADELLADAGFAGRVERRRGDIARDGDAPEADAVVLHRVVCCYPDPERLVRAAAERASHLLVLTYPRHSWWMRAAIRVENAWHRARRRTFRAYAHDPVAFAAAAGAAGLSRTAESGGLRWRLSVFERRRSPVASVA